MTKLVVKVALLIGTLSVLLTALTISVRRRIESTSYSISNHQMRPDSVIALELINADTDVKVTDLNNGTIVTVDRNPSFNIRAVVSSAGTQSIKFGYNGNSNEHVENVAPYSFCKNRKSDFFKCTKLGYGSHTITATPYSGSRATGRAGISYVVTFSILQAHDVSNKNRTIVPLILRTVSPVNPPLGAPVHPAGTSNTTIKAPVSPPTGTPSKAQTTAPTAAPTDRPEDHPTTVPVKRPTTPPMRPSTVGPSFTLTQPAVEPPTSTAPSETHTAKPKIAPTVAAVLRPTLAPVSHPDRAPSRAPLKDSAKPPTDSTAPTRFVPVQNPTNGPNKLRTKAPAEIQTPVPPEPPHSQRPTMTPTEASVLSPSPSPAKLPNNVPRRPATKAALSTIPKTRPTKAPAKIPTNSPNKPPTKVPANPPTVAPILPPTKAPLPPVPERSPSNAPAKPPRNAPHKPSTTAPLQSVPERSPTQSPAKPPTKAPHEPPTKAPLSPVPQRTPTNAPAKPPTKVPHKPQTKPPVDIPVQSSPKAQPAPTNGNGPTYVPGKATVRENGLLLSQGLTARVIAESGKPVQYANGQHSSIDFHIAPDGAAVFRDPSSSSYKYVSNSEASSNAGVGSITFDENGNVIGYERLQSGTIRNCGGGKTFWNTWLTCEEWSGGHVWEIDPFRKTARRTVLASPYQAPWESAAYDNRNPDKPRFFVTADRTDGPLLRYTPAAAAIAEARSTNNYLNLLHTGGSGAKWEYLVLQSQSSSSGTFRWTTDVAAAQHSAGSMYRSCEGIDIRHGLLYMTCKADKLLFILNLDAHTYTRSSTVSGAFDGQPDQLVRLLDNPDDVLYFCEDVGSSAGVHGRDAQGKYYTILQGERGAADGETTGLAFSPGNMRMYVGFQVMGKIYEIRRTDGLPFSGQRLDIKYHKDNNSNPF